MPISSTNLASVIKVLESGLKALRVSLTTTSSDPIFVDDFERRRETGAGNITGQSVITKFGRNGDANKNSFVPVWPQGVDYPYQSAANTPEIVSDNTNDTSSGTGARTVLIQGLDSDYNEQEEVVTMNGTTPVTLVNSYIRLYRGIVQTAGNSGVNEGQILVQNGANIYIEIEPERSQTAQCIYTIPAGKTGYFQQLRASITHSPNSVGEKSGEVAIRIRPFGGAFITSISEGLDSRGSGSVVDIPLWPLPITEKTDIELTMQSHDNKALVTGIFTLVLVDNES